MPKEEKIRTLHPQGKKGVNISLEKYNTIKDFIIKLLAERGVVTYQDLNTIAIEKLSPTFDGKVTWYVVTVK